MKTKDNSLFDSLLEEPQKPSGRVICLGMTFENDEARRAHFTEELRKKLRDPEFRKAQIDTGFIERHPELLVPEESDPEVILMAAAVAMNGGSTQIVQGKTSASSGWKLFARRVGVSGNPLL